MIPIWIVENFVGDNGYEDLIVEVRKQGMECIILDVRNHFELDPNLVKSNSCVIFQGSIQLFKKLKKELNSYPIGWMTDDNYLCSNYYPYFQKYLFNDNHIFVNFKSLKDDKFNWYSKYGKEALIFIRSDTGDKSFSGQLVDLQDFDRIFSSTSSRHNLKDDDTLIISTPKNIVGEFRFIVTNKKEIIGVSSYMFQGQRTYIPNAPEKATSLCKEILDIGYYPDPVFTIDICTDTDQNVWLMEINSFTSAGTYAAKKDLIVKRVSEIVLEQYNTAYNSGVY